MGRWVDNPVVGPVWLDDDGLPADPPPGAYDARQYAEQYAQDLAADTPVQTPDQADGGWREAMQNAAPPPEAVQIDAVSGTGHAVPSFVPPVAEAQAPAPAPQAPTGQVGTRDKVSGSVAVGQDRSWTGVTDEDYNLVSENLDTRLAGHRRKAADELYNWTTAAGNAAMGQVAAHEQVVGVEVARARAEAELRNQLARLQAEQLQQEQAAHQAAQAAHQAAMADYRAQVARVQAMPQDADGGFWAGLGGAGRAGMVLAMFGEGFLGAQGIQTNVTKNLNLAVDRMIDAQNRRLAQGEKVADMYAKTWDMVRSQSATDAEARVRMRGLALASAQTQIGAELARFDAPMAQARAAEYQAAMQAAIVKNDIELAKFTQERLDQVMKTEIARQGNELSAKAQNYRTATDLKIAKLQDKTKNRELALEEKGQAGGGMLDPKVAERLVRDPETGEVLFYATGPEEQVKDTIAKYEGLVESQRIAKEFKSYTRRNGKIYNGAGAEITMGEYEAALRGMRKRWVSARVKAISGAAASDQERKTIGDQLPVDSWMIDAGRVINDTLIADDTQLRDLQRSRLADARQFFSEDQLRPYRGYAAGAPTSGAIADEAGMENRGEIKAATPDPRLQDIHGKSGDVRVRAGVGFTPEDQARAASVGASAAGDPVRTAQEGVAGGMSGRGAGRKERRWVVAMDEYADNAERLIDEGRLAEAGEYVRALASVATGYDYASPSDAVRGLQEDDPTAAGGSGPDPLKASLARTYLEQVILPKWNQASGPVTRPDDTFDETGGVTR